jgi:hypothetical protein
VVGETVGGAVGAKEQASVTSARGANDRLQLN